MTDPKGDPPSATEPERYPERHARALYARGAHVVVRTAYGLFLVFYTLGMVAVSSTLVAEPFGWRQVVALLLLLAFPLVAATALRTRAVYGSVRGLEVVSFGRRRTVPWSQVGRPTYAWWPLDAAPRVARLPITEQKERTILFFANDSALAELEGLRAIYARDPAFVSKP